MCRYAENWRYRLWLYIEIPQYHNIIRWVIDSDTLDRATKRQSNAVTGKDGCCTLSLVSSEYTL